MLQLNVELVIVIRTQTRTHTHSYTDFATAKLQNVTAGGKLVHQTQQTTTHTRLRNAIAPNAFTHKFAHAQLETFTTFFSTALLWCTMLYSNIITSTVAPKWYHRFSHFANRIHWTASSGIAQIITRGWEKSILLLRTQICIHFSSPTRMTARQHNTLFRTTWRFRGWYLFPPYGHTLFHSFKRID